MTPNIGDIVLVHWVDSARQTEWSYKEPDLTVNVHDSVGYLSHRNDEALFVMPHRCIDKEGEVQHVGGMLIPLRAVTAIEVISSFAGEQG